MQIKLTNLTKKFFSLRGSVCALDNVNLEIQGGEFFVLLGPSGCGKTTLLNLIAGLEKPTSGEIQFDGTLVAGGKKRVFFSPKERNVAMVFQNYALYPHLNVFENIAFPLRISRIKENVVREKVEESANMLGISNLLSAKPGELSGGQRQRVAIARAIVRHPAIFLLDEPLSNLDAQLRISTRGELKALQRRLGITTIYVTHDQIEAMTLGDRIAVLKDGKVEQIGTPKELYENPANTFIGTFIGSPPMNLLKLPWIEEGGRFYIIIGEKKIKIPEEKTRSLYHCEERTCVLGIRPEHITVCKSKGEVALPIQAKIVSIEPLGREMLLHVSVGDIELSVLTNANDFMEGELIEINFDCAKLHIFPEKKD